MNLENINCEFLGIYINFPFCKEPCSYCHYVKNIKFGYDNIPENYFNRVCEQLEDICRKINCKHIKSIYMGGGTPSLLSDSQLYHIQDIITNYGIMVDEVSIEIHPGKCNFNYRTNSFITRYSLGVQSFEKNCLERYRRKGYDGNSVKKIISDLKANVSCKNINIDILFQDKLDVDSIVKQVECLRPDTVTVYPDTNGRGCERLQNVILTLDKLKRKFHLYKPLYKSKFIFKRSDGEPSLYSQIQCEYMGNIVGIGHNSVSSIGEKTYLCRYEEENLTVSYQERINKGNRFLTDILSGIPTGVLLGNIRKYIPKLAENHYLRSLPGGLDINEKHAKVNANTVVYLPRDEYIRFYHDILIKYDKKYKECFLQEIGFGDDNLRTIIEVYNSRLLLGAEEYNELKNGIEYNNVDILKKINAPQIYILVEGIDGSGKDTFVQFLCHELKKRFKYSPKSRISVTGQPNSALKCGTEAKKFLEELSYDNLENVLSSLKENRRCSEEEIMKNKGINILIRGVVTDKGTLSYINADYEDDLGQGTCINKWDRLIIIDADVITADSRIRERGIKRNWREYTVPLAHFRKYFIDYSSDWYKKKIILKNNNINILKLYARKLANELYAEGYSRK